MHKLQVSKGRPKGAYTFDPALANAIGRTVREMRLVRRISQEGLAALADIERSHMGKIERGEHMPSLAAIWKLSKALEVSPSALVAAFEEKLRESARE